MKKQEKLEMFQSAIDDSFLEEAMEPVYKKTGYRKWIGIAACLCLLIGVSALGGVGHLPETEAPTGEQVQLVNPIRPSSAAAVASLGYRIVVPQAAAKISYTTIEMAKNYPAPMAQVSYEIDGVVYTCRALKTEESQDISGYYGQWTSDFSWEKGEILLRLCSDGIQSWVGWYVPEEGTQWCLSASRKGEHLLNDAMGLARDLGFDFSTAPEGAEEVTIRVLRLGDLTVAETGFWKEDAYYTYRTAAVPGVDLVDLSQQKAEYDTQENVMVAYCEGQLSVTEGGAGKLLWMDVVPGLVYSLSTEKSASAEALEILANEMFISLQGDAG